MTVLFGLQDWRLDRPVIDGLEDLLVDVLSLGGLEGDPHLEETVGQALNPDPDGSLLINLPISHVGVFSLDDGVVILIYDSIHVLNQNFGDADQFGIVELPVL